MHRGSLAVCAVAAALAAVTMAPREADSAGIYEDAAAESAFLLAPERITTRATIEFSSRAGTEASIYRFQASFPVRRVFHVSFDQPFVVLTAPGESRSGLGDLTIRARARVVGGSGRSLHALGYVGTGTGNRHFFPYSSQTLDYNASLGYVDTLRAATVWATAGYTWVLHKPANDPAVATHTDERRVGAGAMVALGPRVRAGLGARLIFFKSDARRDLVFGTASFAWTEAMDLLAVVQTESGPVAERAGDWTGLIGVTVRF